MKPYLLTALIVIFGISALLVIALDDSVQSGSTILADSIGISDNISTEVTTDDTPFINMFAMKGHVVGVVTDKDGNLKQRVESDNITVNNGENCVGKLLFATLGGDHSGNNVCLSTSDAGFRFIALEESAVAVAADDVDLTDPADVAGLGTPLFSAATWTNSTGTGAASDVTVVLVAAFTNTSGGPETITGAGLMNASAIATRSMYAHTLFGSSAVVADTDTLTVTWTLNLGEGTVD